ncbi:MAG TPA: YkgJ family cysteine cluster protein [Planctomycetota bacterium]|nr:YkgJ family cysteine cluster protein [Planctomycetota bacterium]HRU52785.1 YkgJ family cysteine cluster protein [Planctomycetota bacterium]
MYAKAFQELESIYEDLESELAKLHVKCQCCGECCNFSTNGMRLYIYHIEELYGMEKNQQPYTLQQGICCFQKDNLCTSHIYRPLGCRTQFCTITLQDIYEQYAHQIILLEQKYNIDYEYKEAFLD